MGFLGSRQLSKRDHGFQRKSSSRSSNSSVNGGSNVSGLWAQRRRSRFARLVLFKKIDYVQLISAVGVFFFFIFVFQIFLLPGSVTDDGRKFNGMLRKKNDRSNRELSFLKDLDFGEDLRFEPLKILAKFRKDAEDSNVGVSSRNVTRFGYKKPKLALVFGDLWVDSHQILMVTVATALQEIGYEIEVLSLEDGPVGGIWREIGLSLNVISPDDDMKFNVDWLNYHGIIVNSLGAVAVLPSLMQEPFKSVPFVWTIHEQTLSTRLRQYVASNQTEMVNSWRKVFQRATVVVFPNYYLPVAYSVCDPGNYFVIQGSPKAAWEAKKPITSFRNGFTIAIVGSHLLYRGLWLEHAFILQALFPNFTDSMNSTSHLKISILAGDSTSNYGRAVETIALNLKYPNETVKLVAADENADTVLSTADLVIYGSFLEEHTFPEILLKAMSLGKPVIAPELLMIKKYVSDKVNGFLFPKEDTEVLTEITFRLVSNGKLTLLAQNAAVMARRTAKNLMVSECVEGYASLLENVLMLPSEVVASRREIPREFKIKWLWHHFEAFRNATSPSNNGRIDESLDTVEKQLNRTSKEKQNTLVFDTMNDTIMYAIWEEQKSVDIAYVRKKREDDELKDRSDQARGTWDEVYRNVRRVDRTLHERDEGELLRTGQPLCIYEPFYGEGTWPFLHHTSLYRGLRLSTKGRRPGADDVDGPARLSLLNNAYYRDVLGEYGAFFAIANRIDRVHKNAWIGFQSWRATARSISLSENAEGSLLEAIEARMHGDALYFWARLDTDSRFVPEQDFWRFCDAVNAGNCRFAFSEALKKMYSVRHNFSSLPEMPSDGGTWSVLHSWVVHTRSFLEFVMFSRMFVDALDAQFYDEHHKTGHCCLSISKEKHCYSRLLEVLMNVWAYHSGRMMVYVHPETGSMQEEHELSGRRGRMWVKWFDYATLKSMDEDLAEEFDSDRPRKRWLWPLTGEKFWRGIYEKEKIMKIKEKERRKQLSREKLKRMRRRAEQKVIGKYVKPVEEDGSNSTINGA